MKKDDVPQDNNRTYGGHKKIIYATDGDGEYKKISSSGWDAEELVTTMAVDALNELCIEAFKRAKSGKTSPLEYHLLAKRFDVLGISQATGFFQWRIKRHFRPPVFSHLSSKTIKRYCDVLGIDETELKSLPEEPNIKISEAI